MTVIACIAPGPSLTREDCAQVEAAGIYTIAVNSAWKWARFADVIFANDACWWEAYASEIDIDAERWAGSYLYNHNTRHYRSVSGWNSGAKGIRFAFERKRGKVILLLGFDCSVTHGTHCHGDHTKTRNPDADAARRWQIHFDRLEHVARRAGVKVINCSRQSELRQFKRMSLHQALRQYAPKPEVMYG